MSNDILTDFINIKDNEFHLIANLIYEKFGVNLPDKKKGLVRGRLNKLVKQLGFNNFKDYYDYVLSDETNYSLLLLIDKITTNHSYFFRENKHFDFLQNIVLPEIIEKAKKNKTNDIRIWCAGCATGEEAYTLAIILYNYFKDDITNWDIGILATDISISALSYASNGIYNITKTQEVPVSYRHKYFKLINNNTFMVSEELKKLILFKRLNLMREKFPFKNKFDIIFCRNVMIYFDVNTKNKLVNKLYNYLNVNGYLFIGHSESIRREESDFKYIKPAIYKKE